MLIDSKHETHLLEKMKVSSNVLFIYFIFQLQKISINLYFVDLRHLFIIFQIIEYFESIVNLKICRFLVLNK